MTGVQTCALPISFKSAKDAICRKDKTALEQLEFWKLYQEHWCEHKPSVTITIKDEEWIEVGAWVYEHFDEMSGVSFLPFSNHIYRQAPYIDCDKKEYNLAINNMPKDVDWILLSNYETTDQTTGSQELSCSSSVEGCEVL